MLFFRELTALMRKELLLEWRQAYSVQGLLVYAFTIVFIAAYALREGVSPQVWVVVFWLLMLFIAVNAIAKSFMGKSSGQRLYLYQLARPEAIILAKLIYNVLLLNFIGSITLLVFLVLVGDPFGENLSSFLPVLYTGATGLAASMTLISGIAAKTNQRSTLMAILSFPVLLPHLLSALSASRKAYLNVLSFGDLSFMLLLVLIVSAVSLLLFPYLWRE